MSEALNSKTPEQSQESAQLTEWDNLANPNESWENHLKQAKELKDGELLSEDNKEPLFMGMKPLQAVENLDKLSEQGVNIDINELLSMLSVPEQAYYVDELYEHGADIDEDKLFEDKAVIECFGDSSKRLELLRHLLDNGANIDTIMEKEGHLPANTEYLDLFISHGVDINKIINRWSPERIADNLELLSHYGANVDLNNIAQRMSSSSILPRLDFFASHGININMDNLVLGLSPNIVAANLDKLKSFGSSNILDSIKSEEDISRVWNLNKAEQNLENGESYEARKNLAESIYGIGYLDICRDLFAFGAISLTQEEETALHSEYTNQTSKFFGEYFPTHSSIKTDNLNNLVESQEISPDDALLIADAIGLITMDDEYLKNTIDYFKKEGDNLKGQKLGAVLHSVRERLCDESARVYSEYMTKQIEQGTEDVTVLPYEFEINGTVESRNIPVKRMVGDEWMMLVHRLGAIANNKDFEHPENWDVNSPAYYDLEGKPSGYISTSAIGDQFIGLAGGELNNQNKPLFYCFTDLPKGSFAYSAEYDLTTYADSNGIKTRRQDFFYTNPRTIVDNTRNRHKEGKNDWNEVALNRYPMGADGKESRLHPNYLAVFSNNPDDIQDIVKKHAAYFNVPIILIDPNKYGRSSNGANNNI